MSSRDEVLFRFLTNTLFLRHNCLIAHYYHIYNFIDHYFKYNIFIMRHLCRNKIVAVKLEYNTLSINRINY